MNLNRLFFDKKRWVALSLSLSYIYYKNAETDQLYTYDEV